MGATISGVHTRINSGLTARLEQRILLWLAQRLPASIGADHLSALAVVALGGAGASFAAFPYSRWAAAGVAVALAVNWFGDSLDGTVARVRHQQRPRFGFYVDHVLDLAGTALLVSGMAISGLMHPVTALAVLAAYLLVCGESFLGAHAAAVFRMSFLRLGPTELRILLIVGAVRAAQSPWIQVGADARYKLFDVGGLVAAAALTFVFVISAVANTRALYRAEPLPTGRESRVA